MSKVTIKLTHRRKSVKRMFFARERLKAVQTDPDNIKELQKVLGDEWGVAPYWWERGVNNPYGEGVPTGYRIGGHNGTYVPIGWYVMFQPTTKTYIAMPPKDFEQIFERVKRDE